MFVGKGNRQSGRQLESLAKLNCEGLSRLHRGFSRVTSAQLARSERSHSKNSRKLVPGEATKHSFEAEIAKGWLLKGEFHGQINWPCNSSDRQQLRETRALVDPG